MTFDPGRGAGVSRELRVDTGCNLATAISPVIPWFQIPGFCVGGTGIPGIQNKVDCDIIVGYKSVYRMCFAMACFFFLFSLIMIRVRSSKDPRAAVQNGFVPAVNASCPLLDAPTHCAPHAPFSCVSVSGSSSSWCWWASRWGRSSSQTATSTQVREDRARSGPERLCRWVTTDGCASLPPVWYYFGVVGSFIFIIIQLILLVDFAHSWNLAWLQNAEDGNRKCWFGGEQAAIVQNERVLEGVRLKVLVPAQLCWPSRSSTTSWPSPPWCSSTCFTPNPTTAWSTRSSSASTCCSASPCPSSPSCPKCR